MKVPDYIIKFANKHNWETAKYLGKYKNYDAYYVIYRDDGHLYYLGIPPVILDDNGKLKLVEGQPSITILNYFPDNEPVILEQTKCESILEMIESNDIPDDLYQEYLDYCKIAHVTPFKKGCSLNYDQDYYNHLDKLIDVMVAQRKQKENEE